MTGSREVVKDDAVGLGHHDLLGVGPVEEADEHQGIGDEEEKKWDGVLHAWVFLLDSIGWLAAFVFLIAGLLEAAEMCGYLRFAYRCMCLPW